MTCSSRSTSAVRPEAMRRPKSSTAVRLAAGRHQAHVVVDEDDQRAGLGGDPADQLAEVGGLLVGQPGRRLVEQHQPRLADHGPGDLDEPPLAGTESPRPTVGVARQPDEVDRPHHLVAARAAVTAGVLVHEEHVLVHGEVGDRLLGLERSAQPPPRPLEVGDRQEIVTEREHPAGVRPHEPAEDVEERRLAGAVGPDQAACAAGEGDASSGRSGALPRTAPRARRPRSRAAPAGAGDESADGRQLGEVLRHLVDQPAGAVISTCRTPIPNRIVSSSVDTPQSSSSAGSSRSSNAATTAPQML